MAARNKRLPTALRSKISGEFADFALQTEMAFKLAGIGLAALGLFAADFSGPYVSLPWYLMGLLICPTFPAALWTAHAFRPYRGSAWVARARADIDTSDPTAMKLVEIYGSKDAKRFLWISALKLFCILFSILGVGTLLLRKKLSWFLFSPSLLLGLVIGTVGCSLALTASYCAWGLRSWIRETQRSEAIMH